MENTKDLLNLVLSDVFNRIMFTEEKELLEKLGNDVTIRDVHVIEAISRNVYLGNSASNIVAKTLKITAGTLTTAVKRLELKGYVTRIPDEKDKRINNLFLTPKGEKINKAHREFHLKMVNTITSNLSEKEEKQLIDLVSKVISFFN